MPTAGWAQNGQLPPATHLSPDFEVEPEPTPNETLAQVLDEAYHDSPFLQAQRYQLRADDEDYAQALAELRPTSAVQIAGSYTKVVPGRTTQAGRFLATSPIITSNSLVAQAIVTQPLYTGGKAAADRDAALAEVGAGRARLRGSEGDLLLQVITTYADIRRDGENLRLRSANIQQLQATLAEIKAGRIAGELTRTDIAQAETQLQQAQSAWYTTSEQSEQDRATFAAVIGHDAGALAPLPELPHLPVSIGAAFAAADQLNPDLDQAIATERRSRAGIAAAAALGKPTVTLNGMATLGGQAAPFYLHNEDQTFGGQAVLTIPLTNGGRVGSLVAQAQDRNSVDRLGIETARRLMVDTVINAWNAMATAQRNILVESAQVASAKVFDDGSFQEYRAGLRSTFDVLFAHVTLLNARIELVNAQHDQYVAAATLLRHVGLLEVRSMMTGTGLYDPDPPLRHAARRGGVPWDSVVRVLDRIDRPRPAQQTLRQPPTGLAPPSMIAPGDTGASAPGETGLARTSPNTPLPGTTGTPQADWTPHHP